MLRTGLSLYLLSFLWMEVAIAKFEACEQSFEIPALKPIASAPRILRMGSPVALSDLNLPTPPSERFEKVYRWPLEGTVDEASRALLMAEKDVLNLPFFDFVEIESRGFQLQKLLSLGLQSEVEAFENGPYAPFEDDSEENAKPNRGRMPFDVVIDDHMTLHVHPVSHQSFLLIKGITVEEMRQISQIVGAYPRPAGRMVYPFIKEQALDRLFLAQRELALDVGASRQQIQSLEALKAHIEAQIVSRGMERLFRKYFLRSLPESDLRIFAERVHRYLESYKNDSIFESQRDLFLLSDLVPGTPEIKTEFRDFIKSQWPVFAKEHPEGVRSEVKFSYDLNLDGTNIIVTGRLIGEVRLATQSENLLLTDTFVENPGQLNIRISPTLRPDSPVDERTLDRILQRFAGVVL